MAEELYIIVCEENNGRFTKQDVDLPVITSDSTPVGVISAVTDDRVYAEIWMRCYDKWVQSGRLLDICKNVSKDPEIIKCVNRIVIEVTTNYGVANVIYDIINSESCEMSITDHGYKKSCELKFDYTQSEVHRVRD